MIGAERKEVRAESKLQPVPEAALVLGPMTVLVPQEAATTVQSDELPVQPCLSDKDGHPAPETHGSRLNRTVVSLLEMEPSPLEH